MKKTLLAATSLLALVAFNASAQDAMQPVESSKTTETTTSSTNNMDGTKTISGTTTTTTSTDTNPPVAVAPSTDMPAATITKQTTTEIHTDGQ